MLKQEFKDMLASMGAEFSGLAEALECTQPEVSVRVNISKGGTVPPVTGNAVPWCREGYYLSERPSFTFDPAMHQGLYYVQDASSMCLYHIISSLSERLGGRPLRLLDACAAPGGKTLCASDALPAESLTVANEFDFRRAEVLRENVIKWGAASRVVVSRGDTARFSRLNDCFDIVCVDAPCSGEGMMRKDATAREQWSRTLIAECAERQRQILDNVWSSLRPGGFLVYSTCTFNLAENEQLIGNFATDHNATFEDTGLSGFPGIVPSQLPGVKAARFLPGRIRGEGLFVCILCKPGANEDVIPADMPSTTRKPAKSKKGKSAISKNNNAINPAIVQNWLATTDMALETRGDAVTALPVAHASFISLLRQNLDTILAGTDVATIRGRDLVPTHELAMTTGLLRPDTFPRYEVDRPTSLRYLRREAIMLEASTPKGFVLLTYNDNPLGFVKNLGNRANNLYPAPWRILKSV